MSAKKLGLLCVIIFAVFAGIGLAVQLIFKFPGMPAFAIALSIGAATVSVVVSLNTKNKQ